MKLKSLIAIAALALCAQGAMAQPKSHIQAQADADKKAETSLSERAKAQYTAQMPAPTDVVWKRDIYRTLDMTKEKNAALYYPVEPLGDRVNLFTLIIRLVADGKVPAYEYRSDGNELFTEDNKYKVTDMLDKFYIYYEDKGGKLTIADSDIPSGEVLSYFIKESKHRLNINLCRCKKCFTNTLTSKCRDGNCDVSIFNIKYFSYKRETV